MLNKKIHLENGFQRTNQPRDQKVFRPSFLSTI